MICIGLSGWGDHAELYEPGVKPSDKLKIYAKHFPVVEVDSSFYAVLQQKTYDRWVRETGPDFSFIIKTYQAMTGHLRGKNPFPDEAAMYSAFRESIQPVAESGKLTAVLVQYPPWFDCTRANVDILRGVRERLNGFPLALELRNQSWFTEENRANTLAFMKREQWIHSICDEPQAGEGSVPTVLQPVTGIPSCECTDEIPPAGIRTAIRIGGPRGTCTGTTGMSLPSGGTTCLRCSK